MIRVEVNIDGCLIKIYPILFDSFYDIYKERNQKIKRKVLNFSFYLIY